MAMKETMASTMAYSGGSSMRAMVSW